MKQVLFFLLIIILASCKHQSASVTNVQNLKFDSLSARIGELMEKYKPGLGEIMTNIQMHHAKLWFSGINGNWKLAAYEIKELKERIEQAKAIETERPEINNIPIIYTAIDGVEMMISNKNLEGFKSTFSILTKTCNTCHKTVNFEFNVITIPTTLPLSNQDFRVQP